MQLTKFLIFAVLVSVVWMGGCGYRDTHSSLNGYGILEWQLSETDTDTGLALTCNMDK